MTIVRQKRRRYTLPHMALDKLPEPTPLHTMDKPGDTWRAHLSGVGGMGIGVVNAILVRAGHKEGYRVLFQDKKGLAIRNGGVYSQISFVKDDDRRRRRAAGRARLAARSCRRSTTGSIPYGKADLLLGIDILEAARAIDPRQEFRVASAERTSAVLNTYKQPTVYTLLGKQDFDPEAPARGDLRDLPARDVLRQEHLRAVRAAAGQQAVRQHHDAGPGLPARADPGVGLEHRLGDQGLDPPGAPQEPQGVQHRPQAGPGAAGAARASRSR